MSSRDRIRVAIYARVSTEEQAQGYSLDQQVKICKDFCKKKSWLHVPIYIENGVSGSTLVRPKFDLMIRHAEISLFDIIVVYRLDRISRSNVDLQVLVEYLKSLDIRLVSATEPFDMTTLNGKLLFDLMASIAEWERGLIRERTSIGMRARAEKGLWHGGQTPFGYDYIPKKSKHDTGELRINEEEANIVRMIFKKFIGLKGIEPLQRFLNNEDIKNRYGNKWCKPTLSRLLSNNIYIGKVVVKDIETDVPDLRMIDDIIFDKAQKIKEKIGKCWIANFGRPKGVTRPEYCDECGMELLGVRAYCSNCGTAQWIKNIVEGSAI